MDIIWNSKKLPYETLDWSGTDTQASRQIEFTLPWNPYDKDFKNPNIKKGDVVELREGTTKLFTGTITTREKTNQIGTARYVAMDYLHHLLRSTGTYIFKKQTPEAITKKVCDAVAVKTTGLTKTGITIPKMIFEDQCLYDIIVKAYRKVKSYTGRNYMPTMNGTKVTVIEKGVSCGVTITEGINITSASFTDTVDNMVDIVRIYNDKHKEVGTVKNDKNLSTYGVYQQTYQKEKGVSATKAAKAMLVGVTREASIEALGDLRAISGYSIKIKDPASGLNGTFYITEDKHTFSGGIHMMSLGLAWKDTMEEGAEVTKDEKKKTSSTKSSSGSSSSGSSGSSYTASSVSTSVKKTVTNAMKERANSCTGYYIFGKSWGSSLAYNQEHTYYHSSKACKKLKDEIKKNGNTTIHSDTVKNIKKMKRSVAGGTYAIAHKPCPLCWK